MKERKVIDSFKLLYKLGIPLGLSCFTLPSEDETQLIKVTTADVVRLIFLFSSNGYLAYYNYRFWEGVSTSHKRDTLFDTGIKLISTGSLLLTNLGMIVAFFMREQIWDIVVTLQDIVIKAEKFDMKIGHAKVNKYFSYYLLASAIAIYSIFFAYMAYVTIYLSHFDILYFLSYIKANATFAYLCCKFQFLIFALGIRFYLLNAMFENKINAAIIDTNAVENEQLIGDFIFIVGDFHDQLNSLAIKINSYFATMILPVYAGNFTITVFCCHNLYKTFLNDSASTFYFLAIFLLAMAIYFNILIIFITLGSDWTTRMANRLGVLVHKTTSRTQNKFILQRLSIISQQVLHISPTFSCGFFAMDWPMQFTFVSALASYLIILIQFQNYVNNE